MDQAFLKFFYTGDHFHCTGSSQKMSCNRFCRKRADGRVRTADVCDRIEEGGKKL